MAHDRDERSDLLGMLIPIVVILVIVAGIGGASLVMAMRSKEMAKMEQAAAREQAIRAESAATRQMEAARIAVEQAEAAALARVGSGNPKVDVGENLPQIKVRINRDGLLSVDGEQLDWDALKTRLGGTGNDAIAGVSVQIEADPECAAKHVVTVFLLCKELGLHDISLQSLGDSAESSSNP